MFRTKVCYGDLHCDDCKKVIRKNVRQGNEISLGWNRCKDCQKKHDLFAKLSRENPLKVGDKVAWGYKQVMVRSGKITEVIPFKGIDYRIATAKSKGREHWHIRLPELTNPIGGERCWTRKET